MFQANIQNLPSSSGVDPGQNKFLFKDLGAVLADKGVLADTGFSCCCKESKKKEYKNMYHFDPSIMPTISK